jgi:tetratricopeptide (TPR) repeat protein
VMYPVYVRGEAYLALHQGMQAAAEFQKIVDHRGIVISDPVGAMARLELGRAYRMAGDREKAKAAYSDFLSLWKNADSNLPKMKQAKLEYAQLNWRPSKNATTQRRSVHSFKPAPHQPVTTFSTEESLTRSI